MRKLGSGRRRRSLTTSLRGPSVEALEPRRLLSAPNGPYGLIAAATGPAAVSLRFSDNSTDETAFVIERSANGGPFAALPALPAHEGTGYVFFTDNGVSAGSSYAYRVYAKTGDTPSSVAGPVAVSVAASGGGGVLGTGTVPNGPYGIGIGAVGPFSVQVQFYDNAADETGFVVERSERSDGGFAEVGRAAPSSGAGRVVTFTDSTVSSGTTYYYRAYAVNGPLASSIAGPAAVHTPSNPALLPIGMPNGPYGLTANAAAGGGIGLAFYDNADNEAGFIVERSSGTGFAPVTMLAASPGVGQRVTYTDITASAGQPYSYRVYAVNGPYQSSIAGPAGAVNAGGAGGSDPGGATLILNGGGLGSGGNVVGSGNVGGLILNSGTLTTGASGVQMNGGGLIFAGSNITQTSPVTGIQTGGAGIISNVGTLKPGQLTFSGGSLGGSAFNSNSGSLGVNSSTLHAQSGVVDLSNVNITASGTVLANHGNFLTGLTEGFVVGTFNGSVSNPALGGQVLSPRFGIQLNGSGTTTPSAPVELTPQLATTAAGIVIGSGATAFGTAETPAALVVSGTISPGSSPSDATKAGLLTTGAETWNGGGTYAWKFNESGSPRWDLLRFSTLNIAADATNKFTIKIIGREDALPGIAAALAKDSTTPITYTFRIAEGNSAAGAGAITGFDPAKFAIDTSGFTPVNGSTPSGHWYVARDPDSSANLNLLYTLSPP